MFTSTRENTSISSAEAIVQGISPEGGLFVPMEFPSVSEAEIQAFANLDYRQIAQRIFGLYLCDDFTQNDIGEIVSKAYGSQFDTPEIAPVVKVGDFHVLELWHGPTSAFKDMALQALPTLMTKSAKKTGEEREILVLVATSGDTGKAALEGFKDIPNTLIGVYYPRDGVSDIQKLQMTTQEGENVFVMGVDGNFDDAQTGVKRIFGDRALGEKLSEKLRFSSANSINFGRLLPQVAYYFYAYSRLMKSGEIKDGEAINFCVPTGNFGNILAGYYAKRMGLPVNRLICASNKNNILADFFASGTYDANREFYTTASPSMDILISSNLERLLYEVCWRDPSKVIELMDALRANRRYEVGEDVKAKLSNLFSAGWCGEGETQKTIRDTFERLGYLLDPHTAVAVKVYEGYQKQTNDSAKTVVISTASPFKFAEDVLISLNPQSPKLSGFDALDALSSLTGEKPPERIAQLREKELKHTQACEVNSMPTALMSWLEKRA